MPLHTLVFPELVQLYREYMIVQANLLDTSVLRETKFPMTLPSYSPSESENTLVKSSRTSSE